MDESLATMRLLQARNHGWPRLTEPHSLWPAQMNFHPSLGECPFWPLAAPSSSGNSARAAAARWLASRSLRVCFAAIH
jgi:hypothetical protein